MLENGNIIQFFAEGLRVTVGTGFVTAYVDESILGSAGQSGTRLGIGYYVGGEPIA